MQTAEHDHVGEPSVAALPDGGLRFKHAHMQRNRLTRYRADDVAVAHNRIDRIHRVQQTRPRTMPVRWVMRERITATARALANEAAYRANFRVGQIKAHFGMSADTD